MLKMDRTGGEKGQDFLGKGRRSRGESKNAPLRPQAELVALGRRGGPHSHPSYTTTPCCLPWQPRSRWPSAIHFVSFSLPATRQASRLSFSRKMSECRGGGGDCLIKLFGKTIPVDAKVGCRGLISSLTISMRFLVRFLLPVLLVGQVFRSFGCYC
jgi:hypothetical protein